MKRSANLLVLAFITLIICLGIQVILFWTVVNSRKLLNLLGPENDLSIWLSQEFQPLSGWSLRNSGELTTVQILFLNGVHSSFLKDNVMLLVFVPSVFRLFWRKANFMAGTDGMDKKRLFIMCIQTLVVSPVMGLVVGLAIYLMLSFWRPIPEASQFILLKTAAAFVYGTVFSLVAFTYFSLYRDDTDTF